VGRGEEVAGRGERWEVKDRIASFREPWRAAMTESITPAVPDLVVPSAGPDPLPFATALTAVLGYVRGRRPLWFRSPSQPEGRWVHVPAFGYDRFDRLVPDDGPPGDRDVLIAEGLHGRLDRPGWTAVRGALDAVWPLADAAADRAAGRAFEELPEEEFSVLAEPGTIGADLREIWSRAAELPGVRPEFVSAAVHHRHPRLVPHLDVTTRRQLWPHVREGDSGVEAVVRRELGANAAGFATLEAAVAGLLAPDERVPTALRLHDVLVWLAGSLRLPTAIGLGRTTEEWRRYTQLTAATTDSAR
jgi:hypothetical protein